jgi:hypothetical protein
MLRKYRDKLAKRVPNAADDVAIFLEHAVRVEHRWLDAETHALWQLRSSDQQNFFLGILSPFNSGNRFARHLAAGLEAPFRRAPSAQVRIDPEKRRYRMRLLVMRRWSRSSLVWS